MNMPKYQNTRWPVAFVVDGLILVGCAPKQRAVDGSFAFGDGYGDLIGPARSAMTPEERFAYDYRSAAVARMQDEGVPFSNVHLVERAKTAIGTPYVRGGTSMSGFDCSGFVQWAYKTSGFRSRVPRGNSPCWVRLLIPMKWKPEILWLSGIPGVGIIRGYTSGTANSSTAPGAARAWKSPRSAILISVRRFSRPPREPFGIRCRSRAETDGAV